MRSDQEEKTKEKKEARLLVLVYLVSVAVSYAIGSIILAILMAFSLFWRIAFAFLYLLSFAFLMRMVKSRNLSILIYLVYTAYLSFLLFVLFPAFIIKYSFVEGKFVVAPLESFSDITTLPRFASALLVILLYFSTVFLAGFFIRRKARDIKGCFKEGLGYIGFLIVATVSHELGHWLMSFTQISEIALMLPYGAYVMIDIRSVPHYRLPFLMAGGILMNLFFMRYLAVRVQKSENPTREIYFYSILANLVITNFLPFEGLDGFGFLVSVYILVGNLYLAIIIFLIILYSLLLYINRLNHYLAKMVIKNEVRRIH